MNKDNKNLLAGIVLIAIGALVLADRMGWLVFDPFFAGWWTLFLIIPGIVSMTKQGVRVGNTLLVAVGVILFLQEQGVNLTGYMLAIVLVVVGVVMIVKKG